MGEGRRAAIDPATERCDHTGGFAAGGSALARLSLRLSGGGGGGVRPTPGALGSPAVDLGAQSPQVCAARPISLQSASLRLPPPPRIPTAASRRTHRI